MESKSFDGKFYIARSYMDVPEIDGFVYLKNNSEDLKNKFVKCKIIDANGYDLIAQIL